MAKKIHISLVGGQTLPVYVPLANDNTVSYDIIYLIYSKRTKGNAELVRDRVNELNSRARQIELLEFEAVNINQINNDIASLKSKIADEDEVWLNVSGGTKPWSILFYQAFANREHTVCLYLDQNGYLWNMKEGQSRETTTHNVGFRVLFSLHQINATYTEFEAYTKEDSECLDNLLELRERIGSKLFYQLTEKVDSKDIIRDGGWTLKKINNKCYSFSDGYDEEKFMAPHIKDMLSNTGWFEYQSARLLSQWSQTKNIIMNVLFRGRGTREEGNEVDIIVRTEKKYLFVECKTFVAKPTDIDKFREVSGQNGGIAVKRLLMINYKPRKPYGRQNEEAEKRWNIHQIVQEKCQRYNIPIFVMSEINKDEDSRRRFFQELDNYMAELNEK